jgi:peptide-methionine (S)-S-oxide reductase
MKATLRKLKFTYGKAAVFIALLLICRQSSIAQAESLETQTAIFAGGCFWCIESDFEKLPGVLSVESGYTGVHVANPEYEQVSGGKTGHIESVRVTYDAAKISYSALLGFFWRHIDPTVQNQQFCDKGNQYRSAIFYANDEQRKVIEKSKADILQSGAITNIYTDILPEKTFYVAEDYHQDYYKKNPLRYKYYRSRCGRDERLEEIWGVERQDTPAVLPQS